MKLKVVSPNQPLSPPVDASDTEEKEVSEEDDDDRNHKHRRRETRSQSSERDAPEPLFSRPYRKRNKAYENGSFHKDSDSQSSGTWRNYNIGSHDSGNLNKRRPNLSSYPRAPFESTRNFASSQSHGDFGPGRGRGREPAFWGQRDSRFGSAEVGPMPSSLFAGRGMPTYGQNASWSPFGMVPVLPNGSIDALHPLGLQGPIRQSISPGMNLGIPRQQCRDFEERGFCLRGDMCPMEHGVNRIVVEDVQSLTRFNLPVSLPSTHNLGTPAGQGASPAVGVHNATSIKGGGTKTVKLGADVDGQSLSGGLEDAPATIGADLYDPDQPLWANDESETSVALKSLHPSGMDETMSSLDMEHSGSRHLGLPYGVDNESPVKNVCAMAQLKGKSIWGRIGSSKNNLEARDSEFGLIENIESLANTHNAGSHERPANTSDTGQQVVESSHRSKLDSGRNVRKPSQKALRTLFVNGIPHKDNTKEALLSHFQKFGQVIDIHIPSNSERAFVQFSKREEAEATLRAPDAVMGNRFIKLWWANRDSIPDNGISGSSFVPVTGNGVPVPPVVSHSSVSGMVKDSPRFVVRKSNASDSFYTTASGQSLPVATTGQQKKLENLELLKEEIRKKQEMLDQKRSEFRLQLDRLQKQASGVRQEQAMEPSGAKQKMGKSDKLVESKTSKHSGLVTQPLKDEDKADGSKSKADSSKSNLESTMSQDIQLSKPAAIQASMSPKPSFRPLAPLGGPFTIKRFKLDNRPTSFMIMPPLPSSFENVSALKEHFSGFGDLVSVELERLESDGMHVSETSTAARICFTTRRAAERAFSDGKCFEGHTLQFMWLTQNSNSRKDTRDNEKPSDSKWSVNADQPPPETPYIDSLKEDDSPKEEVKLANDISGGLERSNSVPDNLNPKPKDLRSNSAS
ncbi:RNA metabolism protein [Lithospermum erythrorhizon]|uniref:RNA metabolism protein n=1 Tax=Lithospermum erythrorhizon TaxID=34254 RepID=A0AAV3QIN9_LITER